MKTGRLHICIDPRIKKVAQQYTQERGMTLSELIRLLLVSFLRETAKRDLLCPEGLPAAGEVSTILTPLGACHSHGVPLEDIGGGPA